MLTVADAADTDVVGVPVMATVVELDGSESMVLDVVTAGAKSVVGPAGGTASWLSGAVAAGPPRLTSF